MSVKVVVSVFLILAVAYTKSESEENYCEPDLCSNGETHIACDHYLEFGQQCGEEPELVVFGSKEKKTILELHNHHRNRIALGKLPGYAPAVRMPAIKWNENLAYIASLHSRSCTTENDACRNTKTFKNSGQNIAYEAIDIASSIHNKSGIISKLVDRWVHNEYKHGNQHDIKLLTEEAATTMSHFVIIANERVSDIGCAMVTFNRDDFHHIIFTCNYSADSEVGQRVYESGTACTRCKSGCHHIYNGLCAGDEDFSSSHTTSKETKEHVETFLVPEDGTCTCTC